MGKILADTNVIIYLLEGDKSIAALFDNSKVYISFITELELLSSRKLSASQSKIINQVIQKFVIFDYNNLLKESCISLRIKYSLSFPDAIIAATCQLHSLPLFTADKKLSKIEEIDVSIYTL
jgi:predicted nucleic acid-binding protein